MAENIRNSSRKLLTSEIAPETIGFRLGEEDRKLLAKHATQAGVSAHVLARAFVEQVLRSGGSIAQLLAVCEEIAAIRAQLAELRKDLAVSTAVLLVSGGRTTSEAAKAWVEKNLNAD